MALSTALHPTLELVVCSNQRRRDKHFPFLRDYSWSSNLSKRSSNLSKRIRLHGCTIPSRTRQFKCHCFLNTGPSFDAALVKNATLTLTRSFNHLQGNPHLIRLASAVGIVIFAIWGLRPLVRQSRNIFLGKNDSTWGMSSTYHVTISYIQPLLLWIGAIFICRALDPMILPSEAGQNVKQRLLNFVRSLSTVLAFAHCLSSVFQQAQNFLMEKNEPAETGNMGFQFAVRAVYTAVWVASLSLFMELIGFSTQKWVTAGGLGTVLITLAGREIFTNFLSSVMIHATRPFVLNEWIQTKIGGYEVSGTVEHVGWWSPTIIRGDDREAVHIPNHKFSVNVVRNLSQKTHWRIKTHLGISHLDVGKVHNIVADMRKVLAKNPQVEQQKLHRRVFLDNINPENQALLIMVSCFVKTSRFEEYLCVKEAILLDLLRVITHHRARLATPIRTIQKIFSDADLEDVPFPDSVFNWGTSSSLPLLIEPSYKVNGEDKSKKPLNQSVRVNGDEDGKATPRPTQPAPESKAEADAKDTATLDTDTKSGETEFSDYNKKEMPTSDAKAGEGLGQKAEVETKNAKPPSDPKLSTTKSKNGYKFVEISSPDANDSPGLTQNTSQPKKDAKSKTSFEENIVLGVALEGSKRSLPIEEDTVPPLNPEAAKKFAPLGGGNAVKEQSNAVGPTAGDRLDQQDQ